MSDQERVLEDYEVESESFQKVLGHLQHLRRERGIFFSAGGVGSDNPLPKNFLAVLSIIDEHRVESDNSELKQLAGSLEAEVRESGSGEFSVLELYDLMAKREDGD